MTLLTPKISIDRFASKWAVFNNYFDLVHPFTPYTDEAAGLKAAQDWVAANSSVQPELVYPRIAKMRMS